MELANLLLAEGNTGGAVHHLEAALEVDPHYGVAHHNLRQIRAARAGSSGTAGSGRDGGSGGGGGGGTVPAPGGDFDVKALDIRVRDALKVVGEAEIAARNGDLVTALAKYDVGLPVIAAAPDKHPKLVEGLAAAHWNQGMMLQRLGRAEEGIDKLRLAYSSLRGLNRDLHTPMLASYVFSSLVNAALAGNDLTEARRLCADAVHDVMLASSATPRLMMGTLEVISGNVEAALAMFEDALKVHAATLLPGL